MTTAKGIYIIGTDTDVGKTVVSAGIMHLLLSKGYNACYYKPVSSGGIETGKGLFSYDVSFVKAVSGINEADDRINPFSYKTPVSPHLASKIEGFGVDKQIILHRYRELAEDYSSIVVEGCGGLAVPLTDNGYMQFQLIKELDIGCILVSRTTIGTINHTLLTLSFAEREGIPVYGVIFNGFNGSNIEQDNLTMINKLTGMPTLGVISRIAGIDVEKQQFGELRVVFEKAINIEEMMANVRF